MYEIILLDEEVGSGFLGLNVDSVNSLSNLRQLILSLFPHFLIFKMKILIVPTSQDGYEDFRS